MEKALLVAGKESPAGNDFAAGAATRDRRIIITKAAGQQDDEEQRSSGVIPVAWNRPSALSARNLLLKCFNEFGRLDECVLLFDEVYFATKYGNLVNSAENIKIIEELIASYQYLTMEALARVQKLNAAADERRQLRLVFVYKSNVSLYESVVSSAGRSAATISSPLVSAAAGAFKRYAENTAAAHSDQPDVQPLLAQCDPANELAVNDSALAKWLFDYIDAIAALKRPLSPKQKATWVKAGAKSPGGFGGFFS